MDANNTGSGPNEAPVLATVAESAAESTAEQSTPSPKRRARAEPDLSQADVLAILEQALGMVRRAFDSPVRVMTMPKSGETILLLPTEIAYCPTCKHLRLKRKIKDGNCGCHKALSQ